MTAPHEDPTPDAESTAREQNLRSAAAPLPPFVDWVARHSGWLLFGTILLAALLEGVGIYHVKRRAQASQPSAVTAPASGARE